MKTLLKYFGTVLLFATICMHLIANIIGGENFYKYYHQYFYKYIRICFDSTFGNLSIPFVYILFTVLIFWSTYQIFAIIKKVNISGIKRALSPLIFKSINIFGWIYSLFYFLWAFNYYRPTLTDEMSLPTVHVSQDTLIKELKMISILMKSERDFLSKDTLPLNYIAEWKPLEDSIRKIQTELLAQWGTKTYGHVRIRILNPKGILLSISTAGIYIPFAFEGHIDAGLHTLQQPFTLAHEMAHGYGYTDEGVCNFIGLITCMKSDDSFIRYSGLLNYWKYIYFEIKKENQEMAKNLYTSLDTGIKADFDEIKAQHAKFPDFFPELRDLIYDLYLKIHGVDTGIESYNEIVIQVQKWKKSKHSFDFVRK